MVEVSPFPYQGPLEPHQVHGRDALLAELVGRVTERRVTALLGPRRFGKTSVLRRLAADLTEVSTVFVDLFGVQTHGDAVTRLVAALDQAVPDARRPALELSASVGINLGAVTTQLRLAPRQRPDARALFGELVGILVGVAERTPLLVVFDEFQSITEVSGATAELRTALQHHYTAMGLLFAGSAPSALRQVFTRHDQPFFNQADLVEIEPLDLAAVVAIVDEGFTSTGRQPGNLASAIHQMAGGHPQRTMQAADRAWRHTPAGGDASDRWGAALLALRRAEAPALAATFDAHTADQRKVLRVLASGGALFGAAAQRLELSAGGARHARDVLLADGKLRRAGDELIVTDPLLADWLREHLPA
jgi:uncharacterized protein